jgi:pimeloyl-ACP methyl ester carboxylesterase
MPENSSVACQAAERRAFAVGSLTLRGFVWGRSGHPALCFLHGGSAHAHWFDAVVPAFADRYHVLSLDQRGHGESEWASPPAYGTEEFAADLIGVMDALGWKRMALVGHSMGGHNAMAFAAWHPDRLWALGVVDSRPAIPAERLAAMHRRGHRGPRPHETLAQAVASFRLLPRETTADPALLRHIAEQGIVERDKRFVYRFDPATSGARRPADVWPLLPRVLTPALVVRGEHSPVLPAVLARDLCGRLPRARFVEIVGAYHHLVLDAPDAFARALDDFLRDVLPASDGGGR